MYESVKNTLNDWNQKTNERQKLQHLYLVIIIVAVLVAGIVSLFDAQLGHNIVLIALFALLAFFTNAVVWNLLKASLLSNLSNRPKRK